MNHLDQGPPLPCMEYYAALSHPQPGDNNNNNNNNNNNTNNNNNNNQSDPHGCCCVWHSKDTDCRKQKTSRKYQRKLL